jgi:hypothetical protein
MRGINQRVSKLEHRLGLARDAPTYVAILKRAGQEIGPAERAYIEAEAEHIAPGYFGIVDLTGLINRSEAKSAPVADAPNIKITRL